MDIITYALCKKYIESSLTGAGALKGQKGDNGKSAYELAVKNGYSGTESAWLASLQGKDGYTPSIGSNGNWYINGVDTQIPGKAIRSYDELNDKPFIPSKTSEITNDSGFITISNVPTTISSFTNDIGYLRLNDLEDYAKKDEIPTKTSQLKNDSGFLKQHQKIKTINGESLIGTGNITISSNIDDVQVDGVSVVENKIANISLKDLNTAIGKTFTTNVDVGYLKAGTEIDENTTVAELLYAMLFRDISSKTGVNIYYGASITPWTGYSDLREQGNSLNVNIDTLIASPYLCHISTGRQIGNDIDETQAEYPMIVTSKNARLVELKMWKENQTQMSCDFNTIQTKDSYIYYITTKSDSLEDGGYDFALTFAEV